MPIFVLNTNVSASKVNATVLKELSELIAKMLGKPEAYILLHINADQKHMSFGGTQEPCGYGNLGSIGKVGGAVNKGYSQKLFQFFSEKLGIPGDRMYISFNDLKGSEVGYNGDTF